MNKEIVLDQKPNLRSKATRREIKTKNSVKYNHLDQEILQHGHGSESVIVYTSENPDGQVFSLNRRKNWEFVEEAKNSQRKRSYNNDTESDEETKTIVIENSLCNFHSSHNSFSTDFFPNANPNQNPNDEFVDTNQNQSKDWKIVRNRKGYHIKKKRPPGKKRVRNYGIREQNNTNQNHTEKAVLAVVEVKTVPKKTQYPIFRERHKHLGTGNNCLCKKCRDHFKKKNQETKTRRENREVDEDSILYSEE